MPFEAESIERSVIAGVPGKNMAEEGAGVTGCDTPLAELLSVEGVEEIEDESEKKFGFIFFLTISRGRILHRGTSIGGGGS